MVIESRQKMTRRVEIDVLVVISAEEIGENACRAREIIAATKCNNFGKDLRMTQGNVDRMIRANAAAVRDEFADTILGGRERRDFLQDVGLVLAVPDDSLSRRPMPAVEAFGIDAIDAEQLNCSGLDKISDGFYLPPVFVIVEPALPGREDQHALPGVSEYK